MNLNNLVGEYVTQKISKFYNNHKGKILVGTLGTSMVLNSGCSTTGALIGSKYGGLDGAIIGSALGYGTQSVLGRNYLRISESTKLVPACGLPIEVDIDGDGFDDKVSLGQPYGFRRGMDLFVQYGNEEGTFGETVRVIKKLPDYKVSLAKVRGNFFYDLILGDGLLIYYNLSNTNLGNRNHLFDEEHMDNYE